MYNYYTLSGALLELSFGISNCLAGKEGWKKIRSKSLFVYAEVPLSVTLYLKGKWIESEPLKTREDREQLKWHIFGALLSRKDSNWFRNLLKNNSITILQIYFVDKSVDCSEIAHLSHVRVQRYTEKEHWPNIAQPLYLSGFYQSQQKRMFRHLSIYPYRYLCSCILHRYL